MKQGAEEPGSGWAELGRVGTVIRNVAFEIAVSLERVGPTVGGTSIYAMFEETGAEK